jgi:bifunctional oligoribonuclease and PAP phosphatase NrnA
MSMDNLDRAADAVEKAESLAMACHVGPDGDALGSMLGLALAASKAGKKVVASFGTPFNLSSSLAFLPGQQFLVKPGDFPEEPEVMVVFDAGSSERLGELGSNAGRARTLIVIDHHVTNDGFGDIPVIDPKAGATGQLVYHLLGRLGWPITEDVAECLLTALVTDTGRFQYANTSPETMRIAADLIEAGAVPPRISRHVYEEVPFGYLRAAGAALSRARLDEDAGVVSTVITDSDLGSAGIDWGDIDPLIDLIRLAVEADVAVVAKSFDDGRVKVSLRSRGATDVGALATALGGGGHRLAAGFTVDGDPQDAVDKVISMVGEHR